MPDLDANIDALYQLPLNEFTGARNALAKTLKGDQAALVKRLEKPTVVPWAVNQLYWRERKTFDRLMASGRALRTSQLAALEGKSSDLRSATADHRAALADAVATATQLAAQSDAHPQPDPLSRMLEALSLAQQTPPHPGRQTDVIQPAGFEALAGVTPVAMSSSAARTPEHEKSTPAQSTRSARGNARSSGGASAASSASGTSSAAAAAAERRRAEEAAAVRRSAEALVHTHERQLDRARATLTRADAQAAAVRQQLQKAERAVEEARRDVQRTEQELARSRAALDRL